MNQNEHISFTASHFKCHLNFFSPSSFIYQRDVTSNYNYKLHLLYQFFKYDPMKTEKSYKHTKSCCNYSDIICNPLNT